MILLFIT